MYFPVKEHGIAALGHYAPKREVSDQATGKKESLFPGKGPEPLSLSLQRMERFCVAA
jgi:hypothetical protein